MQQDRGERGPRPTPIDDLDEELPVLPFDGPGVYRLRIDTHGRDTTVDLASDEVTKRYLIQPWPSSISEARQLEVGDSRASVRLPVILRCVGTCSLCRLPAWLLTPPSHAFGRLCDM